ncbi:hypothetical protein [Amycolatopsis sp.]|uniref:hypothetical protein n=1 Tax=Amycolatopsis sp. TaxID=37632 RepID=UPI002C7D6E61|nr:hypothetical protein [Amycolatopsis sp.]HVV12929.1 hypothetical protein [Amycolatopsis sp.]
MNARRVVAACLTATALTLGCAACDDQAGGGASQGANELSQVQTTLDAIDSEVAGDGSP